MLRKCSYCLCLSKLSIYLSGHRACFQLVLNICLVQPPPTYEESIRQSVELPYTILSSSLDFPPPPQSVYTNTAVANTSHPASSDTNSTALPVWPGSSDPTARWEGTFDSLIWMEGVWTSKTGSFILHTSWFKYLKTEFTLRDAW